jgi:CheY-like chemotaxis protein
MSEQPRAVLMVTRQFHDQITSKHFGVRSDAIVKATSMDEACEIIQEVPQLDVLITETDLTGERGYILARVARRLFPHIAVHFVINENSSLEQTKKELESLEFSQPYSVRAIHDLRP